jgi:hypothetical protein
VQITVDPITEREAAVEDTGSEAEGEQVEQSGIPGPVAAGDVIIATDGHPFWVPDLEQWVDAVDLAPGTWLQTSSGTWVQVSAVQTWTQAATVHNLTVQGVHTYHVASGSLDVLNHNCGAVDAVLAEADSVADLSNSKRPGVIEALHVTGNSPIIGYSDGGSGRRRVHPEVQGVLDSVSESSRGANHGGCGLVECLTVALDSGLDPHGATAAASLGRKREHRDYQRLIGPCRSCQALVAHYNIDFRGK